MYMHICVRVCACMRKHSRIKQIQQDPMRIKQDPMNAYENKKDSSVEETTAQSYGTQLQHRATARKL
jgi:hypothetical protein